jgi:hypothetical protein
MPDCDDVFRGSLYDIAFEITQCSRVGCGLASRTSEVRATVVHGQGKRVATYADVPNPMEATRRRKKSGMVVQLRTDTIRRDSLTAIGSLRLHWPEYLMETGEVALYMLSACAFATVLQHPASPVRHAVMGDLARRALDGIMGATTFIAIVMSPWGKQSGGHFNAAVTFTFYRLGKVAPGDATFYVLARSLARSVGS